MKSLFVYMSKTVLGGILTAAMLTALPLKSEASLLDVSRVFASRPNVTSDALLTALGEEATYRNAVQSMATELYSHSYNGSMRTGTYFRSTYYRSNEKGFLSHQGFDLYVQPVKLLRQGDGDIMEIIIFSTNSLENRAEAVANTKKILERALDKAELKDKAGLIETYTGGPGGTRQGWATQEFVFHGAEDAVKIANFLEEMNNLSARLKLEGIEAVLGK